ncbi:MAG: hypothetical protein P4L80_17480 [Xanthobacteraceae bacterium]|nr:hypothetical protein [Xanthobacteraceae bacterium]
MSDRKHKRPNAQKHGVFAATAIVPGESREEFEELHSGLIEEWQPDGASEEDAVLTIAKCVWRKRRVQKFIDVQLAKNNLDPSHPSYNPVLGLLGFVAAMQTKPEIAFEQYASRCLRADNIRYLTSKFRRSTFDSTAKWAEAVINEIKMVLLPEVEIQEPVMETIAALLSSAATHSGDAFKQELALDERLDAMIDRAVKRLAQIKAVKKMLIQAGMETTHVQPTPTIARHASSGSGD